MTIPAIFFNLHSYNPRRPSVQEPHRPRHQLPAHLAQVLEEGRGHQPRPLAEEPAPGQVQTHHVDTGAAAAAAPAAAAAGNHSGHHR